MLPTDFDILRPCSSTTNPCVSTPRYGALSRVPTPTSSDDWNQPRYWSVPSRYMSAGQVRSRPRREHRLVARAGVEPDVEDVALALERRAAARSQVKPGGTNVVGRRARTRRRRLSCSKTAAARSTIAGVSIDVAARLAGERGNRHAPGALARDAPVRPVREHAGHPLAAPRRDPPHGVRFGDRRRAQAVHADEPLRRRQKDHRLMAAPAVRIRVLERRCGTRAGRVRASAASTTGFASNTFSPPTMPTSAREPAVAPIGA